MTTVAPVNRTILRTSLLQRARGIGPERALHLVERLGDDLDAVLSDLDRIEEVANVVAPGRPRLARRIVAGLMAKWSDELGPEYETMAWFDQHGLVDQPGLSRRIVRVLGERTRETLETNPYVLAKTLPWLRMDEIGCRVLGMNLAPDAALRSQQRLLGAIDNAVSELMASGHTAIRKEDLHRLMKSRIGSDPHLISMAEDLAEKHSRFLDAGPLWRFVGCAFLERDVESHLDAMAFEHGSIIVTPELADQVIAQIMPLLPCPLSTEQMAAVRHALLNPFAVITGGAGTGKTTMVQAIVLAWEELGGPVHLCALAGKAALRLSQATHRLARTIHRTLTELAARQAAIEDDKRSNADWSLFDDRTMVIVDEASMPDLGQWARLLKAMPAGCRLVMVGDTAQLPPIGFGLVFHLVAQRPDTANLTHIFRQDDASGIPVVADAIRHRRPFNLKPFDGLKDGVSFLECRTDELEGKASLVAASLGGFGEDGLALHVIAATNKRVATLNRTFHDMRRQGKNEVKGYLGALFTVGDPVVHLENDYKRGLFNGMLGTVIATAPYRRSIDVSFEGQSHTFVREDLIRLGLAYALTCHKLQGSQAARVIITVEPSRLLEPSWLYTAITRAEEQTVIVGSRSVLRESLTRDFAWKNRVVGLTGHVGDIGTCN